MLRARGGSDRDEEVVPRRVLGGVLVQRLTTGLQEEDKVLGLVCVGGILPVYVEAVEAPVLDKL